MEEFTVGQIFVKDYTPDAAAWCNASGKYSIYEIDADEEGNRRFQIQEIPEPTAEEAAELKRTLATSLEARISAIEDMLAEIYGD